MTANTYSSPGYIRVQWPWIGMIDKLWHVWSSPCTIYNISKYSWWIFRKDQDLHESWRYTMDQDLHNGWRYLEYTRIKSREIKSHEHWHDQGGSINKMEPVWKVFYINRYEYMSYFVSCLFMAIVLLCIRDCCIYLQLCAELYHCIVLIGWLVLPLGSSSLHFSYGIIMYFGHSMTPLTSHIRGQLL